MSRYKSDPDMWNYEKPSFCSQFLHYTWKTISCLFSHIALVALVVSYCVLGAYTFASLEVANEKTVKEGIHLLRDNVTKHLWSFIDEMEALIEHNFTDEAEKYLKNFEGAILKAMTKDGWDGEEDQDKVQWSFTGALFYSIIVITTIGYGHIAPKTTWGKVVTIFYAILGIPLMLLCLSNIGDIMATSFRFLYWRVCCYFCTKKPKKKRNRSSRSSVRTVTRSEIPTEMQRDSFVSRDYIGTETRNIDKFISTHHRGSSKSRNNSFRRSVRTSTKSADSGFGLTDMSPTSHSDTELRYHDEVSRRGAGVPKARPNRMSEVTPPKIRHLQNSTPTRTNSAPHSKANSLDRRKGPRDVEIELDPVLLANTPILCNKYVVGKNEGFLKNTSSKGAGEVDDVEARANASTNRRAKSMPRNHYLELPRFPSPESSDREDADSFRGTHKRRHHSRRRSRSPNPQLRASPRMMTPLGYGHPSKYLDDPDSDEDYYDYYDDYEPGRARTKPVPIWLCVLLVLSYILAGAYLFTYWEEWPYLDAAYFCFITLTTIGFGDLVPAKGVTQNATVSIALCSLYLLFGISLLAMSFNLVQDEVISNVKSVAKTLGIIKTESEDSEEEF